MSRNSITYKIGTNQLIDCQSSSVHSFAMLVLLLNLKCYYTYIWPWRVRREIKVPKGKLLIGKYSTPSLGLNGWCTLDFASWLAISWKTSLNNFKQKKRSWANLWNQSVNCQLLLSVWITERGNFINIWNWFIRLMKQMKNI